MSVETDRELLEFAAKAAGLTPASDSDQEWVDDGQGGVTGPFEWKDAEGGELLYHWNPLTDDGDALRLAVKLGITMYPSEGKHDGATTTWAHPDSEWITVDRTEDPCADMRLAIVRAAAAIGEQMP